MNITTCVPLKMARKHCRERGLLNKTEQIISVRYGMYRHEFGRDT